MRDGRFSLHGQDGAEGQDLAHDSSFTQLQRLLKAGDGKIPHPQLLKKTSNIGCAEAVGIGLDDSHDLAGADVTADAAAVLFDVIEIDLEPCTAGIVFHKWASPFFFYVIKRSVLKIVPKTF